MPSIAKLKGRKNNFITKREIIEITGPLHDEILAAIVHTGADLDEIRQAFVWLYENHHTHATSIHPMSEKTRQVYEILDYADTIF